MLEAFERHLNTIDIGRKFENAKTNSDKIAIAKEFLEKNGYVVSIKEDLERTGFNSNTLQPPDYNPWSRSHIGAVGSPAGTPMRDPFSPGAWLSTSLNPNGGGSSRAIRANDPKVLQAQYIVPDDQVKSYPPYGDLPGRIKERLLSQILQEVIDHSVFITERSQHDYSLRAKMKLGVFRP